MDKSVNKSTSRRIGVWRNVENPGSAGDQAGVGECLKNMPEELIFVKNVGSNHLFDSKMNWMFAKFAKLSDKFTCSDPSFQYGMIRNRNSSG